MCFPRLKKNLIPIRRTIIIMKKYILILFLFLPVFAFAEDKPRLAIIVSFDCPNCYEMSGYIDFIDRYLVNNGYENLSLVPIITSEKDKGVRESYFYAADALNKRLGRKVSNVLFKLGKERIPINSANDLADWMEIEYPEEKEKWKRFASKSAMSFGSIRLSKAILFSIKSGFLTTPSFVKVSNDKIKLLITNEKDVGAKVEKVLQIFMEDN